MKIVAISKRLPGADVQKIIALGEQETRAAWALYKQGIARELCFDKEQSKGVIVFEAADHAEARRALATLPLVQAGQIDFDLYTMGPYAALENLFAR
jgi:hypothetical protein